MCAGVCACERRRKGRGRKEKLEVECIRVAYTHSYVLIYVHLSSRLFLSAYFLPHFFTLTHSLTHTAGPLVNLDRSTCPVIKSKLQIFRCVNGDVSFGRLFVNNQDGQWQ